MFIVLPAFIRLILLYLGHAELVSASYYFRTNCDVNLKQVQVDEKLNFKFHKNT